MPSAGIGLGTDLGVLTVQELLQRVNQLEELILKNNIKVVPQYSLDYINQKIAENNAEYASLPNTKENKEKKQKLEEDNQNLYEIMFINPEFIEQKKKEYETWKESVDPIFKRWYNEMKKVIPKNFGISTKYDLQNAGVPAEIANYMKDTSRQPCFNLISMTPHEINNQPIASLTKCISEFDIREQVAILRNFPEIFTGPGAKEKNLLKSDVDKQVKKLYDSVQSRTKRNKIYNIPDPNDPKKTVDFLEHTPLNLSDETIITAPIVTSAPNNSNENVSANGATKAENITDVTDIKLARQAKIDAEMAEFKANKALMKKPAEPTVMKTPSAIDAAIAAAKKAKREKEQAEADALQAQAAQSKQPPVPGTVPGNNARPANSPFGNGSNPFANFKFKPPAQAHPDNNSPSAQAPPDNNSPSAQAPPDNNSSAIPSAKKPQLTFLDAIKKRNEDVNS